MDLVTWAKSQWDRILAVLSMVAGAVTMLLGWRGVSGTAYPAEQLPYLISAGLGGLFLLGISAALWLSADLHDEWRKLDRLERAIREAGLDAAEPESANDDYEPHPEPTTRIPAVAAEGVS